MSVEGRHRGRSAPGGRFYLWRDRALYIGPDLVASVHAHRAVQVCIGLSGGVRLRGAGERFHSYAGALIPSNLPHETDVPAELLASFWIEPDSPAARRLAWSGAQAGIQHIAPAKLAQVTSALHACWRDAYASPRAEALLDTVLARLATREPERRAVDPRLARARAMLDAATDRRMPLAEIAAQVTLSPSRLAHLLRAEIGMAPRRYLLWLRLRDALGALGRGASITDAAHDAGFADAAHLSRTFRRMLGFAPSTALRVSRFVQAGARAS